MDVRKITALIVAGLALVNIILDAFGLPLIQLEDNTIYTVVSAVILIVAWVSNVWFNFNYTDASKVGQHLIDRIKSGNLDVKEILEAVDRVCDAASCNGGDTTETEE